MLKNYMELEIDISVRRNVSSKENICRTLLEIHIGT